MLAGWNVFQAWPRLKIGSDEQGMDKSQDEVIFFYSYIASHSPISVN